MTPGSCAPWLGGAALAVLISLAAGAASAQTTPAAAASGLRGYEPAPAPASAAISQPKVPAASKPELSEQAPTLAAIGGGAAAPLDQDPAPRFSSDAAPRTQGLSSTAGGAQCRSSCAQDRYLCRSTADVDHCDSTWARCVAACPEASPDAL